MRLLQQFSPNAPSDRSWLCQLDKFHQTCSVCVPVVHTCGTVLVTGVHRFHFFSLAMANSRTISQQTDQQTCSDGSNWFGTHAAVKPRCTVHNTNWLEESKTAIPNCLGVIITRHNETSHAQGQASYILVNFWEWFVWHLRGDDDLNGLQGSRKILWSLIIGMVNKRFKDS